MLSFSCRYIVVSEPRFFWGGIGVGTDLQLLESVGIQERTGPKNSGSIGVRGILTYFSAPKNAFPPMAISVPLLGAARPLITGTSRFYSDTLLATNKYTHELLARAGASSGISEKLVLVFHEITE